MCDAFINAPIHTRGIRRCRLSEALRHNNTLQRLTMVNVECDAGGARHLSDALANVLLPCNIHTLVLDNNPIGPDGANYLAQGAFQATDEQVLPSRVLRCPAPSLPTSFAFPSLPAIFREMCI